MSNCIPLKQGMYRKTSNIRRTLGSNKIVDHSDVDGASPFGAAPTAFSFSTWRLAWRDTAKKAVRQFENLLSVGIWCVLYLRLDGNYLSISKVFCIHMQAFRKARDLRHSAATQRNKIPDLQAKVTSYQEEKSRLETDLKNKRQELGQWRWVYMMTSWHGHAFHLMKIGVPLASTSCFVSGELRHNEAHVTITVTW